MFCENCGNQLPDDAWFCNNCGIKLIADDAAQQPVKKKPVIKRVWFWLLVAVVIAAAAAVVIFYTGGKTDYIAAVRRHAPFERSYGIADTYGAVFDMYINSPEWSERKSGDIVYVDISGALKGSGEKLVISIGVAADSRITPHSVTVDGERSPTQNDAAAFLLLMFEAYDNGDKLFDIVSGPVIPQERPLPIPSPVPSSAPPSAAPPTATSAAPPSPSPGQPAPPPVMPPASPAPEPAVEPPSLLAPDEARRIAQEWLYEHPIDYHYLGRGYEDATIDGEEYFEFFLDEPYMYWFSILVHKKTGEMLARTVSDGMDYYEEIEPLDDWYNRYYTEIPSTIRISGHTIPGDTHTRGKMFDCNGVVSSDYELIYVTAGVYDMAGYMVTGATDYPNAKTYDFGRTLDYEIYFDQLGVGYYVYAVSAADVSGAYSVLVEKYFTVVQ